jgi:hypothetical protein
MGSMAGVGTLFASLWLVRRAIGNAHQRLLPLASAIAASAPLIGCAWWMLAVLGSSE